MAYTKDEMSTWIDKHFKNLNEPLLNEKNEILNRPLSDANKVKISSHLFSIVDAQNSLIDLLRASKDSLPIFGKHSVGNYVSWNSTWEDFDRYDAESRMSVRVGGIQAYIDEKLTSFNRDLYKDEIYEIETKLSMLNSERIRLQNWLEGIGYNSKMSEGNKLKTYNLLVDAGVNPDAMERKFKYELTLTGIASGVTKGEFGKIETKSEKVARERALMAEQQK